MEKLKKCLLLPIDGSEEAIRPIEFLSRLYTGQKNITLILAYFQPPLPPVYQEAADSHFMVQKKRELLRLREEKTRAAFERAKGVLIKAGFSEGEIQEHIQTSEMSVAQHACMLANIKKVDAVVVQRKVSSNLEGFLRGDPTDSMVRHCVASPIWICDGSIDIENAVICVDDTDASLRAADHASFMLTDTSTKITILHVSKSISRTVASPGFEWGGGLREWLESEAERHLKPYLDQALETVRRAGIEAARVSTSIVPGRGNPYDEIAQFCQNRKTGILALGHSEETWSFFRGSVTKKLLADFRNMAIWVTQ